MSQGDEWEELDPEPERRRDYKDPLWGIRNPDAHFKSQRGREAGKDRCPKCRSRLTVRAGWPFCIPCNVLWFDDFAGFVRRLRDQAIDPVNPRQDPPATDT